MVWIKRRLFYLWVTFSMSLCAALFWPWAYPRETVSGLMGRWACGRGFRRRVGRRVGDVIDGYIHPYVGTDETCIEIYQMEREARRVLYPDGKIGEC